MGANIMCEYSRDEWVNGMSRMACDSIDKLRAKLPELRGELRDPARFQEVYSFAFGWAREVRLLYLLHWGRSCTVGGHRGVR
jgi:DCN1-like protein 1/2